MSPELGFRASSIENNKSNLSGRVKDAYDFAKKAHEGQVRKSGEPYFTHCEAVFKILKEEWGVEDEDCLVAALLHDTVEDTKVTLEEIKQKFGEDAGDLVSGVTNLKSSNDRENLKKILNESYIDPRVAIIKLADRLHNMRTLEFMEPKKQKEKSRETLDVFTKLAESLGIWKAKTELEDWCFKYLYPKKYQKTLDELKMDQRLSYGFTCDLKNKTEQLLSNNCIYGKVEIKESGCWTLIKKQEKRALEGKGSLKSFKDIDDVVSVRIQLNTKKECRMILGEIEDKYGKDVDQKRYDNFLGDNKRLNGYQAIHTTINFKDRGPVKIALMTKEMEDFNKWGVISLINKGKNLENYILKLVFTPTGNVKFLPKNATGIDFAGVINPRVLAEAESINIDGINYPLSTVIPNASAVEIVLGKSRRAPPEGTENFATMPETKNIIKELRNLEEKDNLIKEGQTELESILIPRGLLVLTDTGDSIDPLLYKLGCQNINDLYFLVGNDSIKEETLKQELDSTKITKEKLKLTSIRLKGVDKVKTLIDIINKIDKNIFKIDQNREDGNFIIRILVEEMNPDDEEKLRNSLSNDERFSEVLVV